MKMVYEFAAPETQIAIRRVVLMLARGEQPSPDEIDILPAVDFEYAESKPYREDFGFPGLVLTSKGREAAAMWAAAN